MKLRPQQERDTLVAEHGATNCYFDESTGELYVPADPPEAVEDEDGE